MWNFKLSHVRFYFAGHFFKSTFCISRGLRIHFDRTWIECSFDTKRRLCLWGKRTGWSEYTHSKQEPLISFINCARLPKMKYNESHVCPQKVLVRHMDLLSDQNLTSINNWRAETWFSFAVSTEHVDIATTIILW